MVMQSSIHRPVEVTAHEKNGVSWVSFTDGSGNIVNAFMPYVQAKAMADAFNAAKDVEVTE